MEKRHPYPTPVSRQAFLCGHARHPIPGTFNALTTMLRALCGLAVFAAFCVAMTAKPACALRCDGKIIDSGTTKAEVREACGEPTCIRRPPTTFVRKGGIYWPIAANEEWVYNFGPQQFVQFIRFYQGKVVFIQSGDYGWTGEEGNCEDIPEE